MAPGPTASAALVHCGSFCFYRKYESHFSHFLHALLYCAVGSAVPIATMVFAILTFVGDFRFLVLKYVLNVGIWMRNGSVWCRVGVP